MNKITSFCIDHDKLGKGLYVSRIDGDVITYDMRMVVPNAGVYLENAGLHTFEHLLATYVRNSKYSEQIIYVGPMGCRTGFYFLTRDTMSKEETIKLLQEAMAFISDFHDAIPGAQESKECGNYLDHNLEQANVYAKDYREVIKQWTVEDMVYPE
ncbi:MULTISPECIES: S-ribosylhomocysteine lyase [Bacillota]|jgi:S-ribosylhomocysteine lyase|uniref:S-ribosylhomocysteine lyase n=2 Tax=Amedibacillus TaxID=2749846 RepID=A0A7G9GRE3_9FIRM|nr:MULTISPECIES: S-ribosylhomocysteine lyase [Bacillota]QNM13375.1 S-ribosylhomocysteine lyase [[Eubacterium] hominis]MCH4287060.1 S-ribosylhomocysteine lyase [Amedibacillus hominis]RGB50440.1 S-ribosylhomocysteine lyase [Absiella sp. AM22-9]RGB58763.1 S-ribosylhomocysteine lyase [Absiella sp. AM10-20]RGB64999.1 S-ribosylhomocysteine lyase [Absiella sp. AM09-45]